MRYEKKHAMSLFVQFQNDIAAHFGVQCADLVLYPFEETEASVVYNYDYASPREAEVLNVGECVKDGEI